MERSITQRYFGALCKMEVDKELLPKHCYVMSTMGDLKTSISEISGDYKDDLMSGLPLPYIIALKNPRFVSMASNIKKLVDDTSTKYQNISGQDETIAQKSCEEMMSNIIKYLQDSCQSCIELDAVNTHHTKSRITGDPIRSPDISIQLPNVEDPFESLLLVEVKSQKQTGHLLGEENNDWIGQVNTYAQRQLRRSPWLVSKWLFVTDMNNVRVCWFRRSSHGPSGFVSKMSQLFSLSEYSTIMKLLFVLHQAYQMEVVELKAIQSSLSTCVLGVGATSVVCGFGENRVIKCFFTHDRDSGAIRRNEIQAFKIVEEYYSNNSTEYVGKHILRLCSTDKSKTRLILEPRGRVVVVFPIGMISKDKFLPLVNVLKVIHKHGFVHRDVGPTNIILHGDELTSPILCLIDFGFLQNMSTRKVYSGATYFASERILTYFGLDWSIREDKSLIEIGNDDLESLVKTVAYCVCPFVRFRIDRLRSRCKDKADPLKRFPHIIKKEWEEIRKSKYSKSYKLLNEWKKFLDEQKKEDMYAIVEKLLSNP